MEKKAAIKKTVEMFKSSQQLAEILLGYFTDGKTEEQETDLGWRSIDSCYLLQIDTELSVDVNKAARAELCKLANSKKEEIKQAFDGLIENPDLVENNTLGECCDWEEYQYEYNYDFDFMFNRAFKVA